MHSYQHLILTTRLVLMTIISNSILRQHLSPESEGTPLSYKKRSTLRWSHLAFYWPIVPLIYLERLLIGWCRTIGIEASLACALPAVLAHSASAGQRRKVSAEEDRGTREKRTVRGQNILINLSRGFCVC